MNLKIRNQKADNYYFEILKKMSGERRLRIGFELFNMAIEIMIDGIKAKNSGISEEDIQKEVVRRMLLCHRKNSLKQSQKFLMS